LGPLAIFPKDFLWVLSWFFKFMANQ